jgi:hypothetical protein
MSSPCNALVGAHPLVATHVVVHPFSIVPHSSSMSVGDHLPNSFLGCLLDGEEENSLASNVEETRALELRFSKEAMVGKEEHVERSWTNVSFLCLLHLVENKYWEYNCKPSKESNWKAFANVVHANFPNDV